MNYKALEVIYCTVQSGVASVEGQEKPNRPKTASVMLTAIRRACAKMKYAH